MYLILLDGIKFIRYVYKQRRRQLIFDLPLRSLHFSPDRFLEQTKQIVHNHGLQQFTCDKVIVKAQCVFQITKNKGGWHLFRGNNIMVMYSQWKVAKIIYENRVEVL